MKLEKKSVPACVLDVSTPDVTITGQTLKRMGWLRHRPHTSGCVLPTWRWSDWSHSDTLNTADFFANAWCNLLPILPICPSTLHYHPGVKSGLFLSQKAWRKGDDFNFLFNTKNTKCSTALPLQKRRKRKKKTEKENSLALRVLYSWGLVMLDFKKPFHCQTSNRESNRCQRTPDTRQADRTCFWTQRKGCWINAVGRVILPWPLVSLQPLPVNDSSQIKILVSCSRPPPLSNSSYLWSSAPSRTPHQSPCQLLYTFPLDQISVNKKKEKKKKRSYF